MKFCILTGSPRKGNTAALLSPFIARLEEGGAEVTVIDLHDKQIAPCQSCYRCQDVPGEYGCPQRDDMAEILPAVLAADCVVFATPIYTWYCTPPMKAFLDRLYCVNKFYGIAPLDSLWRGQSIALIATCGYEPQRGSDLLEEGLRRYAAHSGLTFAGCLAVRDEIGPENFTSADAVQKAERFADTLMQSAEKKPA